MAGPPIPSRAAHARAGALWLLRRLAGACPLRATRRALAAPISASYPATTAPTTGPGSIRGIDLAIAAGQPALFRLHGRVTYVGVSYRRAGLHLPRRRGTAHQPGLDDPAPGAWTADGRPGPYTVKYGHTILGSQQVNVGDFVQPGQIMGRMGSTGCSTGPHVHVMVQNERGQFLDPMNFIGPNRTQYQRP